MLDRGMTRTSERQAYADYDRYRSQLAPDLDMFVEAAYRTLAAARKKDHDPRDAQVAVVVVRRADPRPSENPEVNRGSGGCTVDLTGPGYPSSRRTGGGAW
jgi:hypothetical protein